MKGVEFIPPNLNIISIVNEAMKQNATILEMNKAILEKVQLGTMIIEAEKKEA